MDNHQKSLALDKALAALIDHRIDHFGVEVTSRCNLNCLMCPRGESQMPEQDLAFPVFQTLLEIIPPGSLVDLNGWGEPLLHPRLIDMVRLLKQKGCFTGFSTNGLLLTENKAQSLLSAGVDYLAFSLDGASPRTYQAVRGGLFEKICQNIKRLVRARHGTLAPQISLTFVMLKANIEEVPAMVELAAQLGVDFVRLKKVDVFTQTDYEQLTYNFDDPYNPQAVRAQQQTRVLQQAIDLGMERGVGVQLPRLADGELPFCWMEPEHTIFVNSLGSLAPCCVLGHSTIRFISSHVNRRFAPFIFGNLSAEQPWFGDEAYAAFIGMIQRKEIPTCCKMCPKICPDVKG